MKSWTTLSRRTVFQHERFLLSRAELERALADGEFKVLAWVAAVALGLGRLT